MVVMDADDEYRRLLTNEGIKIQRTGEVWMR